MAAAAAYLFLSQNSSELFRSSTHTSSTDTRVADPSQSIIFEVLGPGGKTVVAPPTQVPIGTNTNALSASSDGLKANKLAFQTGGSGAGTYITSIGGLAQQDNGPLSGWLYKVNNTFPDEGPSVYKVKPGDLITWIYTNNLGKDVGAPSAISNAGNRKASINNFNFQA
ncbi:MAG: DUF4430 domain-containing protein [Niameybacter sp.]